MSDAFPARIHPILARSSRTAVVFRRGPSKRVCTVLWDMERDRFTVGQWLKGRIYERRSDISPDGRYLIYFAMNGKWDSETGGSWTAISRAPWLKAVVLFGKGDCWNGGGLFTGARKYWLNDDCAHETIKVSTEVERDERYRPERYGGECTGVYYPRLQRDGWKLTEHLGAALDSSTTFEKPLRKGWVLKKIAHEQIGSPPGKGCSWDEPALENEKSDQLLVYPQWEWAEMDGKRLVFAERGCLYRCSIGSATELGEPELLFDFNPLSFEARSAPY